MTHQKIFKVVAGTPNKTLKIGAVELDCYVLENGQRVISGKSIQKSLGLESGAGNRIMQFLNKNKIKPFLEAKFDEQKFQPIKYRQPTIANNTVLANGYDANLLKTICDIILAYRRAQDHIKESEKRVADKAEVLLSGFASVGIIALIDEVTGYQKFRKHDELQAILERYIAPEFLPWVKRFPDIFYQELYRLKNLPYNPNKNKHSWVGHLTNKLIYEQLPKGVLEELRSKSPKNAKGYRAKKLHQFLTDDIGNPHLEKQLISVITLMRISPNYRKFESHFNRAFSPQQTLLELPDEEE